MQTLRLFSPAKINLFLHITAQRNDGYHDLQSVFRSVDFGDQIDFYLAYDDDNSRQANCLLTLTGADHLTDSLNDNLISKAVQTLALHYPQHARPLRIHLDKRIPTGAGLGGGSSNCATTLIALNQLWDLRLSTQTLIDIAATLGADVPFFIFSHAHQSDAIATGIGEMLTPIHLPKRSYLLLMPDDHLATAHFFKHPALQKNTPIISDLDQQIDKFELQLTLPFHNCFEAIAMQDSLPVKDALAYLHNLPCQARPRMTGTGSAVFIPLCDDEYKHASIWQQLAPCRAVICDGLYGL
ncbi:4-(cytidine 5'-diphospho)-2-C-methyl-D-erythritol kinase [Moraxella sp. Tifton1]|uniref:4-(cytidine 5'-diphospho)-2-C-methyl-D-erythritol kinase n=1 Tax=Moraxella oculi TaxID=2940516 RepID=UPI0020125D1C|nr:4-(cytidine 5'-diphospho)-2-C-methyl-D-erythritol kinase [Moraxella sp. Tifton1]MCL1623226.1 4-(cytidine 5'-diphospho)-2-C-methyl-D-erythritol kinase [Moraxella sp. Tifton1]